MNIKKSQIFSAMVVAEGPDGKHLRTIEERAVTDLPDGDLLIRVQYSSLNYKDALSATGVKGVTHRYPHTPGIDAAGIVGESGVPEFSPGDEVIVIGHDLGMNTPGGFGEFIRIPAGWAVKRPSGLSLRESMVLGTAGFTAAMSLDSLIKHGLVPDSGDFLVTGATGGVGSVAVALLAKQGFRVTAATGKGDQHAWLRDLGASEVIERAEVIDEKNRPMLSARWAGVVDTVGGDVLSTAIRSTRQWGAVAACGNVASPVLTTTIFPFILRGVTLYGINSEQYPIEQRARLWQKLAGEWKLDQLEKITREVSLEGLSDEIDVILVGGQVGRIVVHL